MTDPTPATRAQAKATLTPNRWVPRPDFRRYIYDVLAAAGPLVAFYGWASDGEIALWLGVGATLLGTPAAALARVNVPKGE